MIEISDSYSNPTSNVVFSGNTIGINQKNLSMIAVYWNLDI